jgi:2-dehydropantoate 2-reductase
MKDKPRIAVVGAGAMGSLFGGLLAENGLEVTLIDVWKEHVDAIKSNGLKMVGFGGDRYIDVKASDNPAELSPVDVVFVQCKAAATAVAVKNAKPIIGEDTVVISFQNGLGNEETIAEIIGEEKVLGGLTAQAANIEGPGIVRNHAELPSWIGEMSGGQSERVTQLCRVLTDNGIPTDPSENIRKRIWNKLFANLAVSPMSGITNLQIRDLFAKDDAKQLAFAIIDEALKVGQAEGLDIGQAESREVLLKIIASDQTNKSSLCVDILNKRETEIDFINGSIVRLGEKHAIATPLNKAMVALVKTLEYQYLG